MAKVCTPAAPPVVLVQVMVAEGAKLPTAGSANPESKQRRCFILGLSSLRIRLRRLDDAVEFARGGAGEGIGCVGEGAGGKDGGAEVAPICLSEVGDGLELISFSSRGGPDEIESAAGFGR